MKKAEKKREDKIDELTKNVNRLTKTMTKGFASIHKEIKELKDDVGRIKKRLDYIVKVNKLKDLPNQ